VKPQRTAAACSTNIQQGKTHHAAQNTPTQSHNKTRTDLPPKQTRHGSSNRKNSLRENFSSTSPNSLPYGQKGKKFYMPLSNQ
jgi:hypothetical protein